MNNQTFQSDSITNKQQGNIKHLTDLTTTVQKATNKKVLEKSTKILFPPHQHKQGTIIIPLKMAYKLQELKRLI